MKDLGIYINEMANAKLVPVEELASPVNVRMPID
jgi:hypothetical protein